MLFACVDGARFPSLCLTAYVIADMPGPGRLGMLFACVAGAEFTRLCLTAYMIVAMLGTGRPGAAVFAYVGVTRFPRLCLATGMTWWFEAWKGLGRGANQASTLM